MAEIADFQVFPQKIKLAGKVPHVDISVKLPVDLSPDAKGVLAFMVRDIEVGSLFAKDALLKLLFYDPKTETYKFINSFRLKPDTVCGLVSHFPVQAGTRKIRFSATDDPETLDSITISDIVLWFQRNV